MGQLLLRASRHEDSACVASYSSPKGLSPQSKATAHVVSPTSSSSSLPSHHPRLSLDLPLPVPSILSSPRSSLSLRSRSPASAAAPTSGSPSTSNHRSSNSSGNHGSSNHHHSASASKFSAVVVHQFAMDGNVPALSRALQVID